MRILSNWSNVEEGDSLCVCVCVEGKLFLGKGLIFFGWCGNYSVWWGACGRKGFDINRYIYIWMYICVYFGNLGDGEQKEL